MEFNSDVENNQATLINENSNSKVLLFSLVSCVFGIIIGVVTNMTLFNSQPDAVADKADCSVEFNDGIAVGRAGLLDKDIELFDYQKTGIYGAVLSFSDNKLEIESQGPGKKTFNFTVNDNTQVFKSVPKPTEEISKEMEVYQSKIDNMDPLLIHKIERPSPFRNDSASLEDIKIGDLITVKSDQDLMGTSTIISSEISIDSMANLRALKN